MNDDVTGLPRPWERQPKESQEAFYCFCLYRDLGPLKRSATTVSSESARSVPLIKRWQARWFWVERARAWDKNQDEERRREHTEATLLMAERQANQAHGYQEVLFAPVRELLERMRSPIFQVEFSQLPTQNLIELALLTARLFPQVARAEREARGAPLPDLSAVYDEATGEIKTSDIDAIEAYDWYRSMAAALEVAGVTRRQIAPPDEEAKP